MCAALVVRATNKTSRFSVILIRYFFCCCLFRVCPFPIPFALYSCCCSVFGGGMRLKRFFALCSFVCCVCDCVAHERWENLCDRAFMQITNYETHSKIQRRQIFYSIFVCVSCAARGVRAVICMQFFSYLCGPRWWWQAASCASHSVYQHAFELRPFFFWLLFHVDGAMEKKAVQIKSKRSCLNKQVVSNYFDRS